MHVLVIGGTGLISTAIVDRLLHTGHRVTLFNRGQSPTRFEGDVERIHGDRQDFDDFAAKMQALEADAVVDMITFDARTAEHAVATFRGRTGHYLFCSTVCVYGGPLSAVPADETEPHTPVSAYGRGKSEAEAVFMRAWEASDFPITMFRPSHCYGPGQPLLDIWGYNPCLVNRMREGRPILVPGDGTGLWQPGHVADMAKGFVGALGRKATMGEAYNLVGGEIMDWRTFHTRMAAALGLEAHIVPMTTPQIVAGAPEDQSSMLAEIFQYHAAYSNAKLRRDVPEFTDLVMWEDGVRDTVAWMDAANVHRPADDQPWIDALAAQATAFEEALRHGRSHRPTG